MTNKVHQTCIAMLTQRGYNIIENDDEKMIGEIDNEKICIFLLIAVKLNVNRIQEYIGMSKALDIKHCVIIYGESVTPVANKVVLNSKDIEIELFNEQELQYNITEHTLVPKHIKLNKEETVEFKKKYGTKIPILYNIDPISKFYKYNPGDIIKIIRKNGFIGYRIVKILGKRK